MGVAPPCAGGFSQKKAMCSGGESHCAISWWKGIRSDAGASLAVKTRCATSRAVERRKVVGGRRTPAAEQDRAVRRHQLEDLAPLGRDEGEELGLACPGVGLAPVPRPQRHGEDPAIHHLCLWDRDRLGAVNQPAHLLVESPLLLVDLVQLARARHGLAEEVNDRVIRRGGMDRPSGRLNLPFQKLFHACRVAVSRRPVQRRIRMSSVSLPISGWRCLVLLRWPRL
eukprot:scaffold9208_cov98-Isochrysis_galbana.AAC.11